ncbi:MAG: hypothetical protein WBM50_12875 [Acidimicrobiales bacterium]
MTELNWRALIVEDESHSAIYAETFPIRLADALADSSEPAEAFDAFDTTAALEVLATFAGAWGSLHRDAQGHRWQYRSVVTAGGDVSVLAFRAVALDTAERWIAVDDVERAR